MKVLMLNGSPHANGNTAQSLEVVAGELQRAGVETELITVGDKKITGCIGCGACYKAGMCVFADDFFKEVAEKMVAADGLILGSPVYFSGVNGTMKSFLDRAFYAVRRHMRHKVGAGVAVARRAGCMPTLEQLNNYFLISEMVVVSANYWNTVFGAKPGEINQDEEGVQVLRTLGQNMAWMLQMREATKDSLPRPEPLEPKRTNFIR